MGLSTDLLSQFAKVTNNKTQDKKEASTVYGEVVDGGVKLDGSDTVTPVSSTVDAAVGDRVIVMIKNHSAVITGNLKDPSASSDQVKTHGDRITELDIAVAKRVTTEQLNAEKANITEQLTAADAVIRNELTASIVTVDEKLTAKDVEIEGRVEASEGEITDLKVNKLSVEAAAATYATIVKLDATNASVNNLRATHASFEEATANNFTSVNGDIENLQTTKLDAESAKIIYANIDFSNIGKAAIEEFFSKSGMISDLVVGDSTITGKLVGVTIHGDLIEGGTVKADKLVVKGSDGLYYKLNIEAGVTTSSEVAESDLQNGLHGSAIIAKTITATQISVQDLVAFGATIGGFHITESALYSGAKETVDNTTNGVYLDSTGQMSIGNSSNFIKYYKDASGNYKLEISASSITLGSKSVSTAISEVQNSVDNIQIGGRNLLLNSDIYIESDGYKTFEIDLEEINKYLGRTVTISVEYYADNWEGNRFGVEPAFLKEDGTYMYYGAWKWNSCNGSGRLVNTMVLPTQPIVSISQRAVYIQGTTAGSVKVGRPKLELGNKATDWSPAPEDVQNEIDNLVKSIDVEYYLSTSSTALVGGSWSTTAPEWVDGKYMWSRTVTVLQNGTSVESDPTCIAGATGATGATGTGVASITEEYYVSTSKTSQTGGSWSTTTPTWSTGKYIWTRSKIVYKDPASTVYTTPVCDSSWEAVNAIDVGGRNYLTASSFSGNSKGNIVEYNVTLEYSEEAFVEGTKSLTGTIAGDGTITNKGFRIDFDFIPSGIDYIFSFYGKGFDGTKGISVYCPNITFSLIEKVTLSDDWFRYVFKINREETGKAFYVRPDGNYPVSGSVIYINAPKLEKGNKVTDWTPAPEDMATAESAEDAKNTAEEAKEKANDAQALIKTLSDSIAMLVTDGNGTSLMTQTEDGWTFSTANMQSSINATSEGLSELQTKVGDTSNTVNLLQQAIEDLGILSEYVKITTYEGEPCIELGEGDSDFKLLITNTRILFREGSATPAYITNQSLHIGKAVVEEELQQGNFVWKTRSNGNLGLTWKGGNS